MNEQPFRTRTFRPVPPAERPHRTRRGVRVVVTDGEAVLLFLDTDPGLPGSRWWATPGGGLDPGESERAAAVRELAEETGLVVHEDALVGPVMRRVVVHGYSDQVLVQQEAFFLVDVDPFEVDTSGFTEAEKVTLLDHGWFGADDLRDREVWPVHLAEVMHWAGQETLDWGLMHESTVPAPDVGATP